MEVYTTTAWVLCNETGGGGGGGGGLVEVYTTTTWVLCNETGGGGGGGAGGGIHHNYLGFMLSCSALTERSLKFFCTCVR